MNTYLRLVAQPMHPRFQFRKPQTGDPEGPGTVYVILSFAVYPKGSNEYGPYATPIKATRADWELRRTVRPTAVIRELNRQLNAFQSGIETAHAYLSRQKEEFDSNLIIDGPAVMDAMKRMQLGELAPITLQQVYEQFFESRKSLVQENRRIRKPGQISLGTLKTYPKRWVLIQQFLHFQKRGKLPVQNVNYRFGTELCEWLSMQYQSRAHKKPYDTATIHKVIGLLKMLLTYAQSKEYIGANPLISFKRPSGSVANPKPLSSAQMTLLETCELPPALRHQCDSWLVAAELCFHYEDYQQMPKMRFLSSESGVPIVQHERAKQAGTSLLQTVNITPRAARLLDKYGGPDGLYYTSSGYWSRILKKVAKLADLRDKEGNVMELAFGQGRDTGLTMRAVQGGNNTQLSKIAGWTKASHANRYINDPVGIVDGFARKISDEEG